MSVGRNDEARALCKLAGDIFITVAWVKWLFIDHLMPWLWSMYHLMKQGAV